MDSLFINLMIITGLLIAAAYFAMSEIALAGSRKPLDVILPFATPSTFHGVAKHAIFAGVQRQRRSAPAEQGAQHL